MQIEKMMRCLCVLIFLLSLSGLIFAAPRDSTDRSIIPPAVTSQCFTLNVQSTNLTPNAQDITGTTVLDNCTWRGRNAASNWALAVSNATYEQSCDDDEIEVSAKFGVRGVFLYGGEYDLYVKCCKVAVTYTMMQGWHPCP